MATRRMALAISSASLAFGIAIAQCYWPNGVLDHGSAFVPCLSSGQFAMCCRTNDTTAIQDRCLPSGLCASTENEYDLFRNQCTDPTWQSPFCLRLCISGNGISGNATSIPGSLINYANIGVQVTNCTDGTFCCGSQNTTCCEEGEGQVVADILGERTVSIVTSTVTIKTTASVLPSDSTNATASALPTASSELNKGEVSGVIISCCVVALAIGAALMWLFYVRNKQQASEAALGQEAVKLPKQEEARKNPVSESRTKLWPAEPRELEMTNIAELDH